MEFGFAFRQQCAWYNDKEYVTLFVEGGIHAIKGPANMSPFCRRQMAMDSVSWCLFWEKRHEFDQFLRCQARLEGSPTISMSATLFRHFLRHSKKTYLFNESGTVNLGSTFTELGRSNPVQLRMTAQDVAALLLCNDKGRCKIEIIVNWSWKPLGYAPTQPWRSELVQIKDIQIKS